MPAVSSGSIARGVRASDEKMGVFMGDIDSSVLGRTSPLNSAQKDRLTEIQRYLVNIADPAIGVPAARHGYDGPEHRLGWSLWQKAAGVDRPLEHALSQVELLIAQAATPEAAKRFEVLDDFENRWFPRVRNAIRRFVDPSKREAVAAAFFEDLGQVPAGPAVVASVERFLARYADLAKTKVPGVKEAIAALAKKGLTDELIESITATIAAAKAEAPKTKTPAPSAEAIAEASRAQLEAYERLNDWYIDWSETLRAELGYHAAVKLGITSVKGGRGSGKKDEGSE